MLVIMEVMMVDANVWRLVVERQGSNEERLGVVRPAYIMMWSVHDVSSNQSGATVGHELVAMMLGNVPAGMVGPQASFLVDACSFTPPFLENSASLREQENHPVLN